MMEYVLLAWILPPCQEDSSNCSITKQKTPAILGGPEGTISNTAGILISLDMAIKPK